MTMTSKITCNKYNEPAANAANATATSAGTASTASLRRHDARNPEYQPPETILVCDRVSFAYSPTERPILQDISFEIAKRDFVCVLGASGCGKSTLLNILAGYLPVHEGQVMFKGEAITGPGWHRGVVFQQQALYPWLNVFDNIAFGLNMRHCEATTVNVRVAELLELIELTPYAQEYVFNLSGGMRQRVQLARVLANDPELILMDEPLGALDAITRIKIQNLLRKLWWLGDSTFFMITHDIDEALSLATKIIVLAPDPGRIVKTYATNYTYSAYTARHPNEYMDESYLRLKEEIYEILTPE
ncbi:ABC transporter ATP-binding protein [Mageeibacillus indolicus]|uniref:ABC transporter ATP-binding protein n=1 Tax=Mageeibacillus indolicus TaxID=884684 RepID=A0A2J8B0N6_9FIRM|nr:ABC transporter ATP-binding protein [Mageeibacillus indolicus]PNH18339.1 ABC transporter ATP-binding protein [Mageeibacillus indolicus]